MGTPTPFTKGINNRFRITKSLIHSVATSLTERDKRICLDIHQHRFLTTHQALRLHFDSYPRARSRLHRLFQLRVLDRFRPRRATGSHPHYYVLDEVGIQVVAANMGVVTKELKYDRLAALAQVFSPRLRHMTEVNDFFTRLVGASRRSGGRHHLSSWLGERGCFSVWRGLVHPDGYARLESDGNAVSFFLELDGGTEPGRRLHQKLDRYSSVAGMPEAPEALLFCFPSEKREAAARKHLAPCGLTIATAVIAGHMQDPLASNWLPLDADSRVSLIDLRHPPLRKAA